ncbi:NuA4 histone acetyltransferase subunit [Ascosphaera pollenicola]|nr:NuA4 histone acetyltransferase subunit [Ascosphaera pollenicola]
MAPNGTDAIGDRDPRVEDYLNDRIQTAQDLQNLDDILQSLQEQHDLQKKQLREAEDILAQASKASTDHNEKVKEMANAFEQQQQEIDRHLMSTTNSHTADEAVQKFESWMKRIQAYEVAQGYLKTLAEVNSLKDQANSHLKDAPHLALPSYLRLREIHSGLQATQPLAEGSAPHLVDTTANITFELRESLEKAFEDRLRNALSEMNWPGDKLNLSDDLLDKWELSFQSLLRLQEPELAEASPENKASPSSWEPPILLPIKVMVQPLGLRFKYHFTGERPTNRLDKPEFFLSHILGLFATHSEFLISYIQPLLDERASQTTSSISWAYVDAMSSFITAILPTLRQKVATTMAPTSEHPQLMSHFMHELMRFDDEVRTTYNYTPNPYTGEDWKGMTWEVLVKQNWFPRWLEIEKEFALARYHEIIDAPDSGELEYDSVEPSASKPTKAAIRVNDLLETITERYRPLVSFSQRLRFLIDIQISIFDLYHIRLREGLEAYLAMTSTIGRTVQSTAGVQANVEGVAGLERLCRIYGSAEYLEKKMQDWSDDVFFLEIWTELQERVKGSKASDKPFAGPMTVSDVAEKTSSAVKSDNVEGALFDETASAYGRLKVRSQEIIEATVSGNIQTALKPYSQVSSWHSVSLPTINSLNGATPTAELMEPLRTLTTELGFLAKTLSFIPLLSITHVLLASLQSYLWDHVLMRNSFSATGGAQFYFDVQAICDTVDNILSIHDTEGIESSKLMCRLVDGLILLGLPNEVDEEAKKDGNVSFCISDVERKVFESNEGARSVLKALRIKNLTEAEARQILQRRIEIRT